MTNAGFKKSERLCSQKLIGMLFSEGRSFFCFPYSVRWKMIACDTAQTPQVLISVSKRRFRHAVDRNRVKRLTRECYRLNKARLLALMSKTNKTLLLSLTFVNSSIPDYRTLSARFPHLIEQLVHEIETYTENE